MDDNRPNTRLLVPFYQREQLLAHSLPLIARLELTTPRRCGYANSWGVSVSYMIWRIAGVNYSLCRAQ